MPSTVISKFSYDPERAVLEVIFVTGKVYAYKEVPLEKYEAMKTAFSKGIYFNVHIKDKYEFEKIG